MMDTNYFGSVYPTHVVIKSMKERNQGHVVFVSSMGGQVYYLSWVPCVTHIRQEYQSSTHANTLLFG